MVGVWRSPNVNTRYLAYTSLGVLFFYRLISSFYFFNKERSWKIALLQFFFDVLVYREVLNSHNKYKRKIPVAEQNTQKQNDNSLASYVFVHFCFCYTVLCFVSKGCKRTQHNTHIYTHMQKITEVLEQRLREDSDNGLLLWQFCILFCFIVLSILAAFFNVEFGYMLLVGRF